MFVHMPHPLITFLKHANCIPKVEWKSKPHPAVPTGNMHRKISSLALRHSAIITRMLTMYHDIQ